MAVSEEDRQLVASMKEREFNIKKRKRAANAIEHEARKYRRALIALAALTVACVAVGVSVVVVIMRHAAHFPWRTEILLALAGAIIGALLWQAVLNTRMGRGLLNREELRLNRKHSGDLHAGRRWMQFYYGGEDISPYVPQVLYVMESERRFDSVGPALEFVKQHHHENTLAQAQGLRHFNSVVAQGNLVVLSTVDADGRPSSRIMRFVTADLPGKWYVTSAPDTPKVHEFDAGKAALVTVPTEDGAIISSNRVHIRRAGKPFAEVADLYRDQVPGYLDGMTDEDQELELVYEVTLESAKVDSWVGHDLVSLRELNRPDGTDDTDAHAESAHGIPRQAL